MSRIILGTELVINCAAYLGIVCALGGVKWEEAAAESGK